jgi:hypothetical protein
MQISKCNVMSGYEEFLPLIFLLHFRRKSSSFALEEEFEDANSIVCIFYMIYIEDNFHNCMHVNCRNWKWDFELSQIKWDKNEWQPWNHSRYTANNLVRT